MDKDSPGSKRLYALIGEGADGLPRYFVEKLERILEQQESDRTACIGSPKLRVVRADQYVPQEAREGRCPSRKREVAEVSRTVRSLAAILDSLYAVHREHYDEADETTLTPHMMEGLFITGRQLARSASEALERW